MAESFRIVRVRLAPSIIVRKSGRKGQEGRLFWSLFFLMLQFWGRVIHKITVKTVMKNRMTEKYEDDSKQKEL